MKKIVFPVVLTLLITAVMARTSPPQGAPRIEVSSESPALRLKNVRIDSRDGKVRGTAYLNFGYAAPRLPHVHVFALDGSGKVVYEGCDKLNRNLLYPHPRLRKGRDAFSASLPADSNAVKAIKVASSGHDDCKMDDNRLSRLFHS